MGPFQFEILCDSMIIPDFDSPNRDLQPFHAAAHKETYKVQWYEKNVN